MRISVAMATCNGAVHILEQLNSLSTQTRRPDEVVVADDGSSDQTISIVRRWASTQPEIDVRILEGNGPGDYTRNFVRAFAATTGDLIFPCDQDDVWMPEKLERMSTVFEQHPEAVLIIHDLEITDILLQPIGERMFDRTAGLGGPMRDCAFGMASALRRGFLMCCLNPPIGTSYDNWFNQCALELEAKILTKDVLALYRRHPGAVTSDILVSTGSKLGRRSARFSYIRQVLRNDRGGRDLIRQSEKTNQILNWLQRNSVELSSAGIDTHRVDAAISRAVYMLKVLEERQSIRQRWRLSRIIPIASLWQRGGYRRFNGYGAAIKDLVL